MTNHTNNKQQSAICPACGSRLRFRFPLQLGEFIVCDECDTELEVVRMNPLKLDWAFDDPIDDDDVEDLAFEDASGSYDYDDEDYPDAEEW
ncbi:MAG: hypothetical protein KC419_20225 [Anaerolineales bacterium]|nr:hypothetical protein [Anaerolineales bacterium]MCA9930828.1 hypothetical protein [Anaerolineales bacterium]